MTSRGRDDDEIEPLPTDVTQLLARGSAHPDQPDPAARARLRSRLLGIAPAGTRSSNDGRPATATPPTPATAGRALLAKPIALALATYAVGIASGVALHARLRPAASPALAAPAGLPPPAACVAPALPAGPASPAVNCPALAPRPPGRDEAGDRGLGRERALLDQARAALVSGDSAAAFAALDRHRRGFPDGRLAEERDVLRLKALLAAGRAAEARAAAERFLHKHPASLFRPAVERAVADPAATE